MTTKNNEELKNTQEVVEATSEKALESKWQKVKRVSKEKYSEIVTELKNPVKRAVIRRKATATLVSILRAFMFIGVSFVIVFPIFQQFTLSIRHPVDLSNPVVNWIPEHFSLFDFQFSAVLLSYWKGLWCNFQVATISTLCQLVSASLAGYAFSRLKFRGSNIIFWLIMLTLIVPPNAVTLARYVYFGDFDILSFGGNPGLFESLFGHTLLLRGEGKAIVFYVTSILGQGIRSALYIFLFRQFFRGIPIELEESAQIDGAGVVRTFWSVMLPNARGVIVIVALFSFVWQWNDVYYTQMYQISGDSFPMLTQKLTTMAENATGWIKQPQFEDIRNELGMTEDSVNELLVQTLLNTGALMMMAPLIIGYLFVQKLFIEGVERSGIVG